jgi:DNA-binding NarL/FixJ family response regulator
MRVVVADDNLLVRQGLVALLAAQDGYEVVAECGDLAQLELAVARTAPDVVVTDIRMPPSRRDEGVRFAAEPRRRDDRTGVVVLSQYVEPGYALALFEQGSAGRAYLLKERLVTVDEVVRAVEAVAGGGSVVDPEVVDVLVRARSGANGSLLDRLTPRELELLAAMGEGRSNAGIAGKLVLSEGAVEKHINAILGKLGLTPEPELHRRVRAVLLFLADRPAPGR